ncbi:MAG: bifunctional 5,10-methylenetetrahydrofolate dehydrogenase/5,10-methenyltetrahydrofolate cyclohydrolase [Candidatus Moranbacteria bacterium]|nr:bifunctional 5,10-methylenetetrahydrofolate dehydrogenase/5,10-methenyltetrahydrofolate cyclohydrolase [Candidatus Moranbacteria bacterium]
MKILDGNKLSEKYIKIIRQKTAKMKRRPVLAMVLVGDDPASKIYVRRKGVLCEQAGIDSKTIILPENTSQKKLLGAIDKLNKDKNITAIMVQLPLPSHIDKKKIIESVDPKKDADCLHPENLGKFIQEGEGYSIVAPATPLGIIKMLEECKIPIAGKKAVVIGRSNIVGKPMAQFLLSRDATVTVCHRLTKNLAKITREADILVAAVGKKNLVKAPMIKKGAVVIDVGMNRDGKKLLGDVDFENVSKKASYITPVPGGVGPMTIAMLLWNTLELAK